MDLHQELAVIPHKAKVDQIASWIGTDPNRFQMLIELVFEDVTASRYAAWVIGHCMQKHPELIRPHLSVLADYLEHPEPEEGILRSIVKALAESDPLPEELAGRILDRCFQLLMDPKTAIAIRVHAMQTIFNISKKEPDLLRELRMVIEDGMEHGSAGFRSRGKKILREIGRLLSPLPE